MLSNMAKCLLAGVFLLVLVIFAYHERTGAIGGLADDDDTGTSTCIAQENDLKQKIESKDTSIKSLLMQNSELEEKIMQCKDDLQAANSTLEQYERRLGLCDKRFAQKKKELSDCQDKILEYGPEDANAAQQEIWFLRKQVNELKETLKTKEDDYNQLKADIGEMKVEHAVCGAEHKFTQKHQVVYEGIKEELAQEKAMNQNATNITTLCLVVLASISITLWFGRAYYKFSRGDQERQQRDQEHDALNRERQQWKQEHDELIHLRAISQAMERQLAPHDEQPAIRQGAGAGQNEQQGGGGENEGDPPHSMNTPPVQVAPPPM